MTKESTEFEGYARDFLSKKWNKGLFESSIKIGNMNKNFDIVSEDKTCIGDAKYYKNLKNPSAKLSTIAEYVWLLENTHAEKKFLIFGRDIEVPKRWLKRFGSLTKVEFYFLKNGALTDLRRTN